MRYFSAHAHHNYDLWPSIFACYIVVVTTYNIHCSYFSTFPSSKRVRSSCVTCGSRTKSWWLRRRSLKSGSARQKRKSEWRVTRTITETPPYCSTTLRIVVPVRCPDWMSLYRVLIPFWIQILVSYLRFLVPLSGRMNSLRWFWRRGIKDWDSAFWTLLWVEFS